MSTDQNRRKVITALGLALPLALPSRLGAAQHPVPCLRFVSVEDGLIAALRATGTRSSWHGFPCVGVEVGHSDLVATGVQGCFNSQPFAGFPHGHLRIVRTSSEPGPAVGGVRLYLTTLEIAVTGGRNHAKGQPLDFTRLPAAPRLSVPDLPPRHYGF